MKPLGLLLRRAARPAWPVAALVCLALAAAAMPAVVPSVLTPGVPAELPAWRMTPTSFTVTVLALGWFPALVSLLVAAVIWWRARTDRMALACAYMLLAYGFLVASPIGSVRGGPAALALIAAVGGALGQLALPLFFLVFPTGRSFPRPLAAVIGVGAALLLALVVVDLVAGRPVTEDAVQSVGVLLFLLGVVAQILRYRRMAGPDARAQVRWVVYGLVMAALVFLLSRLLALALPPAVTASAVTGALFGGGSVMVALAIVPVCIGIAVLRAGLWNVDRVVNRTIVYGLLTTAVVAIYVVVVAYLGAQLRSVPLLVSLIATGVVAVVLQPLHRLLQRTVNRLMFGLRDEPTAVVAELGRRLQDTAEVDAVLATAAQTLARALRLPFTAVRLRDGTEAGWGEPTRAVTTAPLVFQGRHVGELLLAPRRPGEVLTGRDLALVAQVAPQIAAAADAILLMNDLRASRIRLVETREDERRRLRRDLHDGLGPALAGLALQASAIPQIASTDAATAGRLGEQVAAGIRGVIADVRRLVYGLRPPALDEFGLIEGLRSTAAPLERPGSFRITVEAPDSLPPLPAAVEAAAYRIGVEAIANAARHARASRCIVQVRFDGDLRIDVEDDGVGFPPGTAQGVGLLGMRERAMEVGGSLRIEPGGDGGTVVTARIPVPAGVLLPAIDEQEDRCAS